MSGIEPATRIAALIRTQVRAQMEARTQAISKGRSGLSVDLKASSPMPRSTSSALHDAGAGAYPASMQQLVAGRVAAIALDDPQRRRKAFRLFLEAVLLDEFGRERAHDHGFHQLVDRVLAQMESDPALAVAMTEAGDLLLSK